MISQNVMIIGFLLALVIGTFLGKILYGLKHKPDKLMNQVLKDPDLLLAELKKQGKIVDEGEEIIMETTVNPSTGNKELIITRKPIPNPEIIKKEVKDKKQSKSKKPSKSPKKDVKA